MPAASSSTSFSSKVWSSSDSPLFIGVSLSSDLMPLPGLSIKVVHVGEHLDHPADKILAEPEDTGFPITFTISWLSPCTVGAVHAVGAVANTDAEEILAHRQAVVDDKVIVAVWSCAIPSLLLSGFSTPVCDPKLLICFPLLKNPAETCVTE